MEGRGGRRNGIPNGREGGRRVTPLLQAAVVGQIALVSPGEHIIYVTEATVVGQIALVSPGIQIIYVKGNTGHKRGQDGLANLERQLSLGSRTPRVKHLNRRSQMTSDNNLEWEENRMSTHRSTIAWR